MKVFFDSTYKCNGNCLYCYTNSGEKEIGKDSEMNLEEICQMIDKLIDIGVNAISIGGGEPLMNHFCEICDYIEDKMEISVTTNGSLLDKKILQCLRNRKIRITVSLDSVNDNCFEKIRKNLDLKKIIDNISILASDEIIKSRLSIRSVISTENLDLIEDLIEFCLKLDICKLKINSINSYGRAKKCSDLIPKFDEFMEKLIYLEKKYEKSKLKLELPIKKYIIDEKNICMLGKNSFFIDPYGNIYPCAFSEGMLSFGNIKKDLTNRVINKINKFSHNNHVCESCEINRYKKYI